MTLYLKYRPQTIAELDLDGVREGLTKIVQSGRIPHAFLFAGPRGAGKTSTARILAKIVNCENRTKDKEHGTKGDEIEPCNECETCVAITRGSSLDVIEIDAASNRGVDDIRTLRETVKLSATGGKKKVYIIDEAHMLTTEAANALLKTLEEPPDHVMFILATTAPEKLPETIRSRCTLINFYKGNQAEIIRSLSRVVNGEKFEVEKGAIEELANRVDGSFREAHKLLEQLSFNGKITLDDVTNLTSSVNSNPILLLAYLEKKDAVGAIEQINSEVTKGVNLKVFTTEIITTLRQEMLALIRGEEKKLSLQLNEVQALIDLFADAIKQLPTSVVPQLPLEMAVVKYCIDQSANTKNEKVEVKIENPVKKTESRIENVIIDTEQMPEKNTLESKLQILNSSPVDSGDLQKAWRDILQGTKSKNNSVEALLRAARPLEFDGEILKIEVFYKFHKDKLESTYRDLVEEVISSVFGVPSHIICLLSQEKKRAADILNITPTTSQDIEIVRVAEEIFGTTGDGKVH